MSRFHTLNSSIFEAVELLTAMVSEREMEQIRSVINFQDLTPQKPKKSIGTSKDQILMVILKSILSRGELAYALAGPPSGVPYSAWTCCLGPCESFKKQGSMNLKQHEFLRALFSPEHRDDSQERVSEYCEFFRQFSKKLLGKYSEKPFIPMILIPVRMLPLSIRMEIQSLHAGFSTCLNNLFVCPEHFGDDKKRWTWKFSMDILQQQLYFPEYGMKFKPPSSPIAGEDSIASFLVQRWGSAGDILFNLPETERFSLHHAISQVRLIFTNVGINHKFDGEVLRFTDAFGQIPTPIRKREKGRGSQDTPTYRSTINKEVLLQRLQFGLQNFSVAKSCILQALLPEGGELSPEAKYMLMGR